LKKFFFRPCKEYEVSNKKQYGKFWDFLPGTAVIGREQTATH
jgi:hypothetical protein